MSSYVSVYVHKVTCVEKQDRFRNNTRETQTQSHKHLQNPLLTVNILTFSSLLLYVQYPEQPDCTSLLFTLLFIKSQYTVFLFFAHLIVFCTSCCFLHILLFCTFFYFIAYFTLFSLFLTICMPLCYVTLDNLYSYYFALSTERTWFDYISLLIIPCITYYVTNKETLKYVHNWWNNNTIKITLS